MAVRNRRRASVLSRRRAVLLAVTAAVWAGLVVTPSGATRAEDKRSVRDQIGAQRAIDLLASASRAERLRGIALLNAQLNGPSGIEGGAADTPHVSDRTTRAVKKRRNHARQALVAALKADGQAKTAVERLAVVRALADWAGDADVRQVFVEFGLHARSVRAPEVAIQVRGTVALALARSGDSDAYEQLGVVLAVGGATGDLVAEALTAYPPKDPGWVLAGSRHPTVPFLRALSARDTPSTRKLLRKAVGHTRAPIRAKAALVLDEFGDSETQGLAEYWLKEDSPPVTRLAAFEILCKRDPAAAAAHLPRLLNRVTTGRAAIEIARRCAKEPLTKRLVAVLGRDEDLQWVAAVMGALGAVDDAKATAALVRYFPSATTGALAARALAEHEAGASSMALLTAALRDEATRRNAARAIMGAWIQGGAQAELEPAALRPALEQLLASSDGDDRSLGAWALAFLNEERGQRLLASKDLIVAASAARGWLDTGRNGAAIARRAAVEKDATARRAFAVSLVDIENAAWVPTSTLTAWVDDDPLLAPLAARALAARDDAHARSAVQSLMARTGAGSAAHLRAHVADGLGYAGDPDAVARLSELYRSGEPSVRLAAIRALARRHEKAREPVLALAARYDIDRHVRDAARRALGMEVTPTGSGGRSAVGTTAGGAQKRRFFSHVEPLDESSEARPTSLLVADRTGILRPLQPSADGWIALVGLETGGEAEDITVVTPPESGSAPNEASESAAPRRGTVDSGP